MDFELRKDTKIYVAGHKGLIGSAFIRYFVENGYTNLLTKERSSVDLFSKEETQSFFKKNQPEIVILAAGKTGGINANRDYPADFINENLAIQQNVLSAAHEYKVKKLLFFGSSCMYPKNSNQPMSENQLGQGQLESTSIAYATAKLAGVEMCQSFNRQYNMTSFISVIPNSAYGPNDNFDIENSHVLAALISRIHKAKVFNRPSVFLWGSGSPRREFVYVDDIVSACIKIIKSELSYDQFPINIGVGQDISIKQLSEKIKQITGYNGSIEWDLTKPDGAPRKLLDNSRIISIGWDSKIEIDKGLDLTYQWFLKNKA
jgi:GDP-L-fucose synthase